MADGRRVFVLAPQEPCRGEDYGLLIARAQREGYLRGRLDGEVFNLKDPVAIDYRQSHRFEVLVDRIVLKGRVRKRLADSVEKALSLSGGVVVMASPDDDTETRFSQFLSCPACGENFDSLTPQCLSFNSHEGWCPSCEGLGTQRGMSSNTLIPDLRKSLLEGAVSPFGKLDGPLAAMMEAVGAYLGFELGQPLVELSEQAFESLLYGTGDTWIQGPESLQFQFKGLFTTVDELVRISPRFRKQLGNVVEDVPCPACRGTRLTPVSASAKLRGLTIPEVWEMPVAASRVLSDIPVLCT